MRKPRSVVFLIVWFLWASGKDLDALIRFSVSTDYYIFSSVNLPWVFFVMGAAVFFLNVGAVYFLFNPRSYGIPLIFNALLFAAIQNVVTFLIAFQDLPGIREAYAVGREARGLPVREQALDKIFSENGMVLMLSAMMVLYVVVAYYTHRNRSYFLGDAAEET